MNWADKYLYILTIKILIIKLQLNWWQYITNIDYFLSVRAMWHYEN